MIIDVLLIQISSINVNFTLHTDNKNFNIDNNHNRLNFKLDNYSTEKQKFVMIEKYKLNINRKFNEIMNN